MPTSLRKLRRLNISLIILSATSFLKPSNSSLEKKPIACLILNLAASAILSPLILTERLSLLSLVPPHFSHGRNVIYFLAVSISLIMPDDNICCSSPKTP